MRLNTFAALMSCIFLVACAGVGTMTAAPDVRQQVVAAERAFAKTMADRDPRAFAGFVSEEAVFFSGPTPLHGRKNVVAWWARYYREPAGAVLLGAGRGRGPGLRHARAQFRARPRPGRQADRPVHFDLAPGSAGTVAGGVRQGQPGMRLPHALIQPGRTQYGRGSRMLLSTARMSVWPQKAIDRSSSFWMISRALVTPASPIAPRPYTKARPM